MSGLLLLTLGVGLNFGQQQQTPTVRSPEVQSDGRVTFHLLAPNARQVSVSVDGQPGPLSMQKDDAGI
ncbi:MAG: hypothetical protein ACJ746_21095 [Bryobacteraceae bacterium]